MKKYIITATIALVALFICSCTRPHVTVTFNNPTTQATEAPTEPPTEAPTEPPVIDLSELEMDNIKDVYFLSDFAQLPGKILTAAAFMDESDVALVYTSEEGDRLFAYSMSLFDYELTKLAEWDFQVNPEMQFITIVSVDPLIISDCMSNLQYMYDQNTGANYIVDSGTEYYSSFIAANHGLYMLNGDTRNIEFINRNNERNIVYDPSTNHNISIIGITKISADGHYAITYGNDIYRLNGQQYILDLESGEYVGVFEDYTAVSIDNSHFFHLMTNADEQLASIYYSNVGDAAPHKLFEFSFLEYYYAPDLFAGYDNTLLFARIGSNEVNINLFDMANDYIVDSISFAMEDTGIYFADRYAMSPDMKYLVFLNNTYDGCNGDLYIWKIESDEVHSRDLETTTVNVDMYDWPEFTTIPRVQEYVDNIWEKYNINVLYSDQVIADFGDYYTDWCNDEEYLLGALEVIDNTLANYPEGFFEYMTSDSYLEGINIYLTGDIHPSAPGSISNAAAFANVCGSYQIFVIDVTLSTSGLNRTLYHEISHAIYSRISYDEYSLEDGAQYFDEEYWMTLNPDGFEYYNSYLDENGNGYDSVGSSEYTADLYYSEGEADVYFVDPYAKTYITEDLARLLEYAMPSDYMPDYLSAPHIRTKLDYYCDVISEVWGIDFHY